MSLNVVASLLRVLAPIAGVLAARALLIRRRHSSACHPDYLATAVRGMMGYLLLESAIDVLCALLMIQLVGVRITSLHPSASLLMLFFAGVTAVFRGGVLRRILASCGPWIVPSRLAVALLDASGADLDAEFERGLQRALEVDRVDCLTSSGRWALGLTPKTVRRRLDCIYEDSQVDIGTARNDPELLRLTRSDVQMKFNLLLRHLGRTRLRKRLLNPPHLCHNESWDERDRREQRGTPAERRTQLDLYPSNLRICDNKILMGRISLGIATGQQTPPALLACIYLSSRSF